MNFFNHPLIKIIAQHEVMNDLALFDICGMKKKTFLKEFKLLIANKHMIVGNHDRIHLRFLTLVEYDKKTNIYVREIDLKYTPPYELKKLTGYNETADFSGAGYSLKPKHKEVFETHFKVKTDFDKYSYWLRVGYANLAYKEPVLKRKLSIVHLDDHSLYAKAIEIGVKDKCFPDSEWNHFSHPDKALTFIEDRFTRNESFNIIITDIMHPGLNGYEFGKAIRDLESKYNMFQIPIIAISMCPEDNPLIKMGLSEELFEIFLHKSTDSLIMGNYMTTLLKPHPFFA